MKYLQSKAVTAFVMKAYQAESVLNSQSRAIVNEQGP